MQSSRALKELPPRSSSVDYVSIPKLDMRPLVDQLGPFDVWQEFRKDLKTNARLLVLGVSELVSGSVSLLYERFNPLKKRPARSFIDPFADVRDRIHIETAKYKSREVNAPVGPKVLSIKELDMRPLIVQLRDKKQ